MMRYRLAKGKNKILHQVTPNSSNRKRVPNTAVLRDQTNNEASPVLRSATKRKASIEVNSTTTPTSTPASKAWRKENSSATRKIPKSSDEKGTRKLVDEEGMSHTPIRYTTTAPKLISQSEVQLQAKNGGPGKRTKWNSLSLKNIRNSRQVSYRNNLNIRIALK